MTVFKGYFLIIRRNAWSIFMYIIIFVLISYMIEMSMRGTVVTEGFSAAKLEVAVIDREGGVLGDTLRKVMENEQNLVELEDDRQKIQEELFYANIDYVLIIPEGASETVRTCLLYTSPSPRD